MSCSPLSLPGDQKPGISGATGEAPALVLRRSALAQRRPWAPGARRRRPGVNGVPWVGLASWRAGQQGWVCVSMGPGSPEGERAGR